MSTENKKKVLLGFGAFAVVLIAVLAIWRPPAFRSEDASGSIGTVQKYHAPQITPQDVVLGNETTRHEQQIRYADFLNDAAKLRALSAQVTANNIAAASAQVAAMKTEVAVRWQAEARAAITSLNGIDFGGLRHQADAKAAVQNLAAILQNGQMNDVEMASFNTKFASVAEQAGIRSVAERATAARREVDAAISEMRSGQANAVAKMDGAVSALKAMNAITLADQRDYLKALELESRDLARDSEVLGKMASRPVENQAAARAFDGTATRLEMMAGKTMEAHLGLLVVIASALQDIDANIAAARGAAQASVAGRDQQYERALANASQAFAGTRADFNAKTNAEMSFELNALNSYFAAARAGVRAPQLDAYLANLSQAFAGNSPLAASLSQRDELRAKTQNMVNQKNAARTDNIVNQKNAARTSY